ncbi:Glutathione S-transferase/chloride channel C-terminal [Penicillium paradoxum]|uniref:Glutathione S-transferase/chloride channel C-terminal n=1 Tax=Penicillium paradoxum TaxID=176176 RepID=UPI0025472FC8|nr:Glutathione S-transferase/chloride channel C-terminal [Penicillium paradoxum]KAJ5779511.1 Glutathione S-transferase/chloride channel C-terminal [Penicillium paradoxum]
MDVFRAYTYSTAAWLALQSLPLIAGPSMIVTMLLDETRPATPIEIYFARCFGFGLVTIAVLTVMLTGSIPLTAEIKGPVTTEEDDPKAPYAVPTLIVTSIFHSACAFYAYTWYVSGGQGFFAVGVAGYSSIAAVGLWCMLFASSNGKISRRTGADKRMTGFPFKNSEAAKKHGKGLHLIMIRAPKVNPTTPLQPAFFSLKSSMPLHNSMWYRFKMDSELRLSSPRLASSMPAGDQSSLSQLGQFDPESQPFGVFRPSTEPESQPLQNATHAPHAYIRPPRQGEANNFLAASSSTHQSQGPSGNGDASHLDLQGRSSSRGGLPHLQEFNNGAAHAANMRGALHGTSQAVPSASLSQTELAMVSNAHQAQNNGLATLQSPSQPFQPDFIELEPESVDPATFNGPGELQGFKMVPNPPHLEYWRDRLFNVDEMITLSEEEFQTYFPHVDNVYSHRSTQRYKRKPFVSHYWDCRLKGRPPGTPKSDDPEKKKRKRTARERDLCHVKIKVVEYFPKSEISNMAHSVEPLPSNVLPGMYTFSLNNETSITSAQAFNMLTPSPSLPPNHPGANGGRYFTIQRVNGNGANGKNDGVSGGHQHTLEESDRVKKSSVQRHVLKEKKDKRTKVDRVMSRPGQKSYHTKATGLAAETVIKHSPDVNLKLYGSCFCPFVQRVWIALELKGIPYQYIEVDPYEKPASLLEVNPRGLVPALRHDDWGCYESNVLLEYLEDLGVGAALLPADAKLRAHCRLWADHVNRHIVPSFYRVLQEQDQQKQIEKTQELRDSMEKLLEVAHPKGPFFMGPQMSLVDVQAAPWILRLRRVLKPYRGWPDAEEGSRLASWVNAIETDRNIQATTSTNELYLDSYERYAQNRPNTSQVANAINAGRGLP